MTIVFSMKVQPDSNKVQVLMLCPECREELEVAANQTSVRFRCSEHGELGMLSAAEFKEGLQKAQRRFGEEHGLGEPVRINFLPAEPERVN
jgi:hypothetical protein